MLKKISVLVFTSLFLTGSAMASGYRIPEQSVDSTAKAGGNVASASHADAAYFNPANMTNLEDRWHFQGNLSYIHLGENEYSGSYTPAGSATFTNSAEAEHFFLPTFFVVSPDYNGFRLGLSLVSPYGLAKRWEEAPTYLAADEFSMETYEINPTVSYQLMDNLSIAGGIRAFYVNAKLKNALYELEGDTLEWGWNIAADLDITDDWNIALTYRSNIDLDLSDNSATFDPFATMRTIDIAVSFPATAVLSLATSFKVTDKWIVELGIDRTFWSEYDDLYFKSSLPSPYTQNFAKNWDDANSYHISTIYSLSESLDIMGGIGYDETAVPDSSLSLELPGSDGWKFSTGLQYAVSESMDLGMAVLYDTRENRDVDNADLTGEFSNGYAWFVTVGFDYKF